MPCSLGVEVNVTCDMYVSDAAVFCWVSERWEPTIMNAIDLGHFGLMAFLTSF